MKKILAVFLVIAGSAFLVAGGLLLLIKFAPPEEVLSGLVMAAAVVGLLRIGMAFLVLAAISAMCRFFLRRFRRKRKRCGPRVAEHFIW